MASKGPSLAARRANPGLRSKLPASQLTPTQRVARAYNATVTADNANPLLNPMASLSGHALAKAAGQVVDSSLTPKIQAATQQIGATKAQDDAVTARAGNYYAQLAAPDAANVTARSALAAMTNSQVAANNTAAQGAISTAGQTEAARQASDASTRGAGLGGDTSVVPTAIANASSQQALLGGAQANEIAGQGSDWANLASAMAGARQLKGGEIQGQLGMSETNDLNKLVQAKSDLQASRGDLVANELYGPSGLRQQQYDNAATTQTLGLKDSAAALAKKTEADTTKAKAAALVTSAANTATRAAVTKRGQDLSHTDRQAAIAAAKVATVAKGQKATATSNAASAKAWSLVDDTLGKMGSARVPVMVAATVPDPKDPTKTIPDPTGKMIADPAGTSQGASTIQTLGALRAAKAPEWVIQAALSIRHHGYVIPAVQAQIAQDAPGVKIPARYLKPKVAASSTVPMPGASIPQG